jgi:hypothetical protein
VVRLGGDETDELLEIVCAGAEYYDISLGTGSEDEPFAIEIEKLEIPQGRRRLARDGDAGGFAGGRRRRGWSPEVEGRPLPAADDSFVTA